MYNVGEKELTKMVVLSFILYFVMFDSEVFNLPGNITVSINKISG